MSAYQYATYLLGQPYSNISNSEDLEVAVFAKYGEEPEIEDEIWEAWIDSGN